MVTGEKSAWISGAPAGHLSTVIRLEKLKLKATCRRSRMCHGLLFHIPVGERLPTIHQGTPNAGVLGVIEIFNTYWVTTALCCRLAGESASKIPPMTPKRTTSVKSR